MTIRKPRQAAFLLCAGLGAALVVAATVSNRVQGQKPAARDSSDEQAIRKSVADFARAFSQADAHALAGFWTAQGEFHEPSGAVLVGQAAIEKAFAAFFKENPRVKLDVLIESIRFPAPDLAIEEGVLRLSGSGKELPATTLYSVTHVRQGGAWRIAVSREWGAGQDRLEDLDWLVGRWHSAVADEEVTMTFTRDPRKPFLLGEFTRKSEGKVAATGTLRIGADPRTGQLRSWHFGDDGGHGEAYWLRDGSRWLLDSTGVDGSGGETRAVNVLGRIGPDEFTWRSIDRALGDLDLPDTIPIKLRRVGAAR